MNIHLRVLTQFKRLFFVAFLMGNVYSVYSDTPTIPNTSTLTPTPSFTYTPTPSGIPTPNNFETQTPTPDLPYTPTPTTEDPTETPTNTFPPSTSTPTYTFTPVITPSFTPSNTATHTLTATNTIAPTSTHTPTLEPTPTHTFTATATSTPVITPSFTPSNTATHTSTATNTIAPTTTNTPTLESTPTHTFTATATFTPVITPSFTPSNTATHTPTATNTIAPTATFTPTFEQTPTHTFTATATFTPVITPSVTPSNTATHTPTATNTIAPTTTNTPTLEPTPTHTFTATATFTPVITPSFTPSNTATYTPTATNTIAPTSTHTPTLEPTPTHTFTATATFTPVITPSFTPSNTATYTPTATNTITPTATHTPTLEPTPTHTFTVTATFTPVITPSFTPSNTATRTPTVTDTVSPTATHTPTLEPTPTDTLTATPTVTHTPTPTNTRIPRPTVSPTTASQSPTVLPPSMTPDMGPYFNQKPDFKVLLNNSLIHLADLKEYVRDPDTSLNDLLWGIRTEPGCPPLYIDSQDNFWINTTHQAGIYHATLYVSDGESISSTDVVIKQSHFLFKPWQTFEALQPDETRKLQPSLREQIYPEDFPWEQVKIIFPSVLPEGIRSLHLDAEGFVWIKASQQPPPNVDRLPILGLYVTPTPTGVVPQTPVIPTVTPTPTHTPRPHPAHEPSFTPTAVPVPDLVFESCGKSVQFYRRLALPTGKGPIEVQCADLNQDGHPDFVAANYLEDSATLFLSQGELRYRCYRLACGEACLNILLEDIDGDYRKDVILLSSLFGVLTIYKNGEWQTPMLQVNLHDWVRSHEERAEQTRPRLMAVGYFTQTTQPELLLTLDQFWHIYRYEHGAFQKVFTQIAPFTVLQCRTGKFNGTPLNQLAVTHNQPAQVSIWQYDPQTRLMTVQWSLPLDQSIKGNFAQNIIVKDLDHNQFDDISIVTFDNSHYLITKAVQPAFQYATNLLSVVQDTILADFDLDGDEDLIWAGYDVATQHPALTLLCGPGSGIYHDYSTLLIKETFGVAQHYALATSDFNHDGKPDLIMNDYLENKLILYENMSP